MTLIERDKFGGHVSTVVVFRRRLYAVPPKSPFDFAEARNYGFAETTASLDFPAVMQRKDRVVAELREGVATLLKDVNVVNGKARFISPSVIDVNGTEYTAPTIIIATGSAPTLLPIDGKELAMTSDEILFA